jgi:hypothetical protein
MKHWQQWLFAFFLGMALAGSFMALKKALSADSFPPISYLARELGVGNGAQLPKGIIWNGRPLFFYVIGAQQHPGGRYVVELQAR